MRSFVFGAVFGAVAMYFYMEGFGFVIDIARVWWAQVSAPHSQALHQ